MASSFLPLFPNLYMAAGPPAICCRAEATDFGPVDYGAKVLRCVSEGALVRGTTSGPIDPRARGLRFGERGPGLNAAAEGRFQRTSGPLAGILKGQSPLSRSGQSPERVRAEPGVNLAARGIQTIARQCEPRPHRPHTAGRARRVLDWEAGRLPNPKEQTNLPHMPAVPIPPPLEDSNPFPLNQTPAPTPRFVDGFLKASVLSSVLRT